MSNLVVVAIPEEQDPVWKVSSEEVPHFTLLFLGEDDNVQNIQQITEFVGHAVDVSEHGPFYLNVERRGTLGEDEADVLFFDKRGWDFKWVNQLRSQLLQNDAIRTAYNSAEQHPEWLPHLTLGYPESKANDSEDDNRIYSVCFDRIAVWITDFDGPSFLLEWPDRELDGELAVAYSETQKAALLHYGVKDGSMAETLEHFGVKGMRWGQRKTETVTVPNFRKQTLETKKVTPKKAARMDKQWEKEAKSVPTWISVHNDAATHVNERIGALNDKYEKAHPKEVNDGVLLKDDHPITKEYHKEYVALFKEGLDKSVAQLSNSPTGKKRVKLVTINEDSLATFNWEIRTENVKHAVNDPEEIVFVVERDAQGRIINVQPQKKTMAQTAELGEEFLAHYGVLGMRWGVRNRRGEPVTITAKTARTRVPHGKRRKATVKVEGGENHPAAEDAIKAAVAKAKLKKSGVAALSNRELREVAERIRLEQQAKELVQPRGKRFVKGLLKEQGAQTSRTLIRETTESATGIGGGKKK